MDNIKNVQMSVKNAETKDERIVITRRELEEWITRYQDLGKSFMEHGCPTWQTWFYWGKREVLVDLLKHFADKESEEER